MHRKPAVAVAIIDALNALNAKNAVCHNTAVALQDFVPDSEQV
jgi:hypothetical protein